MRTLLRFVALALLATLIVVVCSGGAALASTKRKPRPVVRPVVLHLHFAPLGKAWVVTDGRYVLLTPVPPGTSGGAGTLIDEQTGARKTMPAGPYAFGGDWLWWPTNATDEDQEGQPVIYRYSLVSGTVQTISVKPCGDGQCGIGPVGNDWLEEDYSAYHVAPYSYYEDLTTGAWWDGAPTSTTPTTVWDFDSPTLTTTLCRPLRNTDTNRLIVDTSGLFDVSGAPMGPFAEADVGPPNENGTPYLERCGSHVHHRLAGFAETANANALLFYSPGGRRTATGIFLPSLRPLRITFPAAMTTPTSTVPAGGVAELLLSSRTLYVTGSDGNLWAATFPERPPASSH